jgi:hypothetical protein
MGRRRWRFSFYLWPLLPMLTANLLLAPRWPAEGLAPSALGPRATAAARRSSS